MPVPSGADGVHAGLGRIRVVRPEGPSASGSLADNLLNTKSVFEDGIELASFSVSAERVRPGEIIHTELMWHALNTPLEDDVVFLQLLDERGRLVAAQESPPLDGRYPTSQWVAGEYVRDPRDLRVPTNVPDGQYRLITGLYRASDQARLNASPRGLPFGSDSVQLRALEVKGRQRVMKAPASLGTPAQVRFGSGALLIGYDVQGLTPSLAASRNLTVTLYWQAVAPMQTAYKVFMHVVGANGQIVGQRDSEPGAGTLPTTGWLEGEYLTDSYVLEVKAGAPPGDYSLYMGWYDPDTGVRLTIYDADGKIIGDRWLARRWTW
ncbi:MAG: hypothetical protein HYR71_14475 [Chloroflexi bacterium]|nr:hypothetical protein [Chloroflexota bacterium]